MHLTPRSRTAARRRAALALSLAAVSSLALTACGTAAGAEQAAGVGTLAARGGAAGGPPAPGAHSAGERLFPSLGNGGYDARSYTVHFDYRPGTDLMSASTLMQATATQALSSFSLDSAQQKISSVTVNGSPADFRTDAGNEKLVVTPRHPLPKGLPFTARIAYTADRGKNTPSPTMHWPSGTDYPLQHWVPTDDGGFALMGQPDRAHLFFPSNDVPSDPARFTFDITTPDDVQAVANGTLVARHALPGGRTRSTYRTRDAFPTDIVQVAVGHFREVRQVGPHALPVRSYVPADAYDKLAPAARRTTEQLAWTERALGVRFPTESYGVLGVGSTYDGVALETATLSTFAAKALELVPAKDQSPIMEHELVHQYFGDAVPVRTWDDMWLSEGHASYYQDRYADDHGYKDIDGKMKTLYAADAQQRADVGPAGHLKNAASVLLRTDAPGELMLYGLREKVGDRTFRDIERTFLTTRGGRPSSTQDYIDVANKVSGQDLTPYVRAWLYGDTTPPMPGHPDWKPDPVS